MKKLYGLLWSVFFVACLALTGCAEPSPWEQALTQTRELACQRGSAEAEKNFQEDQTNVRVPDVKLETTLIGDYNIKPEEKILFDQAYQSQFQRCYTNTWQSSWKVAHPLKRDGSRS